MLLDRWCLDGGTLSIITWVRSHFLTPGRVKSLTLILTPGRVRSLTLSLTQHLILHASGGGHGSRPGVRCSVSRSGARDQRESERVLQHGWRGTPGIHRDLQTDQGQGSERECSSTGDEAHQGYTGISKLIRARDHRESAAEHQTTTHLLDTRR